jgi:hypothetical protein
MLICNGDHNHYEISRKDQSFLKKIWNAVLCLFNEKKKLTNYKSIWLRQQQEKFLSQQTNMK